MISDSSKTLNSIICEHETSWDEWFIREAANYASRSKDPDRKVGCVIVRSDGKTEASRGCNGFPPKIADTMERFKDAEFKAAAIRHAEENAIDHSNEDLTGYTLYVSPYQPCAHCAGAIISAGITRVVTDMSASMDGVSEKWKKNFAIANALFAEAGVVVDHIRLPSPPRIVSFEHYDDQYWLGSQDAKEGNVHASLDRLITSYLRNETFDADTEIHFVRKLTARKSGIVIDHVVPTKAPIDVEFYHNERGFFSKDGKKSYRYDDFSDMVSAYIDSNEDNFIDGGVVRFVHEVVVGKSHEVSTPTITPFQNEGHPHFFINDCYDCGMLCQTIFVDGEVEHFKVLSVASAFDRDFVGAIGCMVDDMITFSDFGRVDRRRTGYEVIWRGTVRRDTDRSKLMNSLIDGN